MPGVVERARALHERGVTEQNLGRPAAAARLYERALRAVERAEDSADGARLSAEIWISLALNRVDLRGADAGLSALDEAQRRAEQVGDPALIVRIHSQHAIVAIRSGMYERARAELKSANRLLEHATDNTRYAILLNTGLVSLLLHDLPAARTALAKAVDFARSVKMRIGIYKALHNLAYLEFLAGDLPSALRGMAEVLELGEDLPRGIPLLDRARVLSESGLIREADIALTEAGTIFAKDGLFQDLAEVELERARCALVSGDVQRARTLAVRARARFNRRGNEQWRRSAELVVLQAEIASGRPRPAMLRAAVELRDGLRAEGLRLVARHASLLVAQALLARGDPSAAERELAELGPPQRGDPLTGRLFDHYVRSCADATRGDGRAASRRARRALDELARYQASFGSIDVRTASAVHGRRLAELDLTTALDSGRAPAVFAAVERARAVSSRLPPVRPPADPVAAELLAELRQNLETLRTVEQDKSASEPLLRARRELERRITARSWTVAGSGAVARPAALADVRGALADRDETMVIYVQAGPRLAAIVLGRATRLVELGGSAAVVELARRVRADLDLLAQPRLPAALRASVRGSLQRSLQHLDTALLAPLAAPGRLVLVSTGVLGQLPWGSLPSLRERPLVVAPSATKWLASTAAGRPGTVSAVALAGPDLARGREEAAAIGGMWPAGRVIVETDASTAALADAMASATVLHVAAHGIHEPENPLFSYVRMADGPVFAHELDQRGHAPEHVVLSACEVGLATIRPGDEALGLASVLLHLGTRSVVAGVARVGDAVAEQTMAAYHGKLAAGADSSIALAEALTEVDADVVPPFVNFGAAWCAQG